MVSKVLNIWILKNFRPITKEEKEQENNKKSSPTKSTRGRVPGQAHSVDNKTIPDGPILPARVQTIRHHLERTTGPGEIYALSVFISVMSNVSLCN